MKVITRDKLKLLSQIVGVLIIGISNMPLVRSSGNQGFNYWSIKCYESKRHSDCMTALTYLESLQKERFVRNNYRCQSYLLGISSDITLIGLTSTRGKNFLMNLGSFITYCG